jgi:hypothetical protein
MVACSADVHNTDVATIWVEPLTAASFTFWFVQQISYEIASRTMNTEFILVACDQLAPLITGRLSDGSNASRCTYVSNRRA